MGNSSSSTKLEIEALKKRLLDIEKLDKNNDGKVSKEEMDAWVTSHKRDMDALRAAVERNLDGKYERIMQENQEYKAKLVELQCHIDLLKKQNDNLRSGIIESAKRATETTETTETTDKVKLSELSKERVDAFVEELLNDENVNIKYLPDFVERQIYRNVFSLLINVLENMLNTTNVQFMGHTITFDLKPQIDDHDDQDDQDKESA
jgi:polyhydroxyalkanoate synthesis regulator phasin